MISFSNVSKQYGKQLIFVEASFQLNPGEKAGLVGPNGAGKTTLFRMVMGEESADDGDVTVPKRLTIGYFRQDVEEMSGRSVLDEAIAGSGRVGDPMQYSTRRACPKCGEGEMCEKRSRKGKMFFSCTRYPQCDHAMWDRPHPTPCPNCKHGFMVEKVSRSGSNLQCPACKAKVPMASDGA